MRGWLYNLFIKRVAVDVKHNEQITETEEIKILNVFLAVLIAWVVVGISLFFYDERGTFGDMFGSINTIFSGFAFGGIIYTIYQQRAEFRLQREEFRLQRDEVAKTNKALDEQVKTANIQRFENTFFQLVSMHQEILNDVDTGSSTNLKGRLYIAELSKRALKAATKDSSGRKTITSAREKFVQFLTKETPTALTYYAHVVNVIKFIHDSNVLSVEEKDRYMKFYKALISLEELKTIYLYYVDNGEVMKFFEDSNFLKHEVARKIFTEEANIYA